jgi:phospholipid/cholesterol/gamma-HCH transport system substrate-binding protein
LNDRGRRFRLGLFVLGTGVLFVALLAFILGNSLDRDRATYFILFEENVKGMVVGSKVNFQGVPIGVVADMRFQDGKTLVELRVDPTRACIQDLTLARMDRLLVTGQVTVELEGYGPQGRTLPGGSFIQCKADPLHTLTASLPEVMDQAASVLRRLDAVLAATEQVLGDTNQQHLTAALGNCERATAELADRTLPAATALLAEARGAVGDVRGMTGKAADALAVVQRLEGDCTRLLRETTALAAGLRQPSQAALAGVRTALDELRGLVRQMKLAPDSLLFGVQRPAAPAGGER